MVIEPDDLNEITFFFFAFFQFFLNDLFETIDDELFDKTRRSSFRSYEFLISFCFLLQFLHIEKREGDMQFGRLWKLLDALFVHSF